MQRFTYVAATGAALGLAIALWRRRRPIAALKAAVEEYHASPTLVEDGGAAVAALAAASSLPLDSAEFARAMDAADPLRHFRERFNVPAFGDGEQAYFAGNSLGLMPKDTSLTVGAELQKWGARGVNGHFEGELPWATCEEFLAPLYAGMVGAKDAELEVGAMNSLTVNLHLLMAAFYRPSGDRAAIIIEAGAFPSDRYAVGSQIRHHGRQPAEWLIEVQPRADGLLHTDDIISTIEANKERLALVLLGGVNYLTGQVLDMPAIASHMSALNDAARRTGKPPIPFGLDLAHAVGNVPLSLHEWRVDFAAWCSYKYLNSGAGCLAALFVHSSHADDSALYPRLSGWWGVPFKRRFVMAHKYEEARGAAAFGVSNVNPLMVACVQASLRVYRDAGGVPALRRKAILLSSYLERLLIDRGLLLPRAGAAGGSRAARAGGATTLQLMTPASSSRRGCQLSLRVVPAAPSAGAIYEKAKSAEPMTMRALEHALQERGVVGDAREPDILRLSPVPLYNSFADVRRAVDALQECLA